MLTGSIAEIGGLLIVLAASLQAAIFIYSYASRSLSAARLDREHLHQFEAQAATVARRVDAIRSTREPAWDGKRTFRIAQCVHEDINRDVCSFYLVPDDDELLPPYRPGQFLTFELPVPGEEHPVVRCYSLSDSPSEKHHYRVSIKRMKAPPKAAPGTPAGVASSYFHHHLWKGEKVDVYAPAGDFYIDSASDRPVVLIAGGIGMTPLISMLNWLVENQPDRQVWLFYGVRNRNEHCMYDHLERIRYDHPNVGMVIAYSEPTEACELGVDYSVEGYIDLELIKYVLDPTTHEFYICGPGIMMDKIIPELIGGGVAREAINFEAFGPATVSTGLDPEETEADDAANKTFTVEFARSNKIVEWTSGTSSLLELAEANGVRARCGCRAGNCGTCAIAIKCGAVGYSRPPGKDVEEGTCLPCISRPTSDLVLDI